MTCERDGLGHEARLCEPLPGTVRQPLKARLSVILPLYNQADTVAETVAAVYQYARQALDTQFVFVDDGSTDGTARILDAELRRAGGKNLLAVSYPRNAGKGFAVKAGVAHCEGDLICFTDGDLAYSLDHLAALAEALRGHDVVVGSRNLNGRRQRHIHRRRRLLGWLFNRLTRFILDLPYRDTQAGLKGFRRGPALYLFGQQRIHGFSFDAELLFLARRCGYRVAEVPAQVSDGHSYKIGSVRLLRDSLAMLRDLVRIRVHGLRGAYAGPAAARVAQAPAKVRGAPASDAGG